MVTTFKPSPILSLLIPLEIHKGEEGEFVQHFQRGVELYEERRYQEALAAFEAALALRQDYPEANANRGLVLANLGRYEEALAPLERALASGLSSPLEEHVRRLRALVLKKLLRGLGVTGGKRAWLGKGPIGAKVPLVLKPGAPTVSEAVIEDRR